MGIIVSIACGACEWNNARVLMRRKVMTTETQDNRITQVLRVSSVVLMHVTDLRTSPFSAMIDFTIG